MIDVGSRGAVCAWLRPTLARPDSHHNASLDAQTLRGVVGGVREATKGSGGGPQQSGPPDHARRVGRAPPNRMGGIPAQAPSFACLLRGRFAAPSFSVPTRPPLET